MGTPAQEQLQQSEPEQRTSEEDAGEMTPAERRELIAQILARAIRRLLTTPQESA